MTKSITDFRDLAGQYLATNSTDSLGTILLAGRLSKEGVRSYRLSELPFANQGLAVAGGNVAAAPLVEPYLTQSLMRGDGHLLDWLTGKPPFKRVAWTLVVFRSEFLKKNPEAAEAYLRAYLRSVAWIHAHDREARRILAKSLSINDQVAAKMHLVDWPLDGRDDPTLLSSLETEMKRLGLITSIIPPRRLYDETLLSRVLGDKR